MTPRRVGERFIDPERGELLVVDRSGCDGCAYSYKYSPTTYHASKQRELTGSCLPQERPDGTSVIFVKPEDYVVFKLTGVWP